MLSVDTNIIKQNLSLDGVNSKETHTANYDNKSDTLRTKDPIDPKLQAKFLLSDFF